MKCPRGDDSEMETAVFFLSRRLHTPDLADRFLAAVPQDAA